MRMTPILNRYIAKNFIWTFIATLAVLLALILLFDVIDLLRRAASRDYTTFGDVMVLGLLKLPQMVPLVLPFSVLISALITFLRLSRSNELVIARSAGLSVWNFMAPVFTVVFVIGVINVTLLNPFSTMMQKQYDIVEGVRFKKDKSISWTSKGLWLREKNDDMPVIIHADSVKQDAQKLILTDVSVLELDSAETLNYQIEASKGVLSNNELALTDVYTLDVEGVKKQLPSMVYPSGLTMDKIEQTLSDPETLSVWEIWSFIYLLDDAGFSSLRHRMHFYEVMASIFSFLAMVFIAAVFSLSLNNRTGGTLLKVSAAILCGFLLFFTSRLTIALGMSASLPIFLAAFGPAIVAIFISATVLLHKEDG